MDIRRVFIHTAMLVICLSGCQMEPAAPFFEGPPSKNGSVEQPASFPMLNNLAVDRGALISKHDGTVLDIREVSSNPSRVISLGSDGTIIAWNVRTGQARLVKNVDAAPSVGVFAKSAALVAYATPTGVAVTCITECSKTWRLSKIRARVSSLAFHENDSALLIAGSDGRVYRWRFVAEEEAASMDEKDRMLERYLGHQTMVNVVTALPVGRAFFSADWDGTLLGWLPYTADNFGGKYDRNLQSGGFFGSHASVVRAIRKPDRGISSLTIAADGSQIIVGSEEGAVEIWNVKGFTLAAQLATHRGRVASVSTNRDGSVVVSVGRDSVVSVLTAQNNPSYLIGQNALQKTLTVSSSQRVENIKSALLLSSGDVLITTSTGNVGELKIDLSTQEFSAANTQPSAKAGAKESHVTPAPQRLEGDSDY
jgi:WD40 repeat protein